MNETKVIYLEKYKALKQEKINKKSLQIEDVERIKTLNLFMKVLETIHSESYK